MMPPLEINYSPSGPVIERFHASNAFVRGLMGPIGSGKTSSSCMEIVRRACQQRPSPDGKRRSRWAVIRNTFPELKTTTIKTWHQWFPESVGRFTWTSPACHRIVTDDLDIEVLFIALDKPDDVSKLLSLELTGALVNEAREIPKAIIDALTGRVGRYPSAVDGGCTWCGIIMDTNPPEADSWWYRLAEEETPEGWEFFTQPSGLDPEAENLDWLDQTPETLLLPVGDPERRAQGRKYYERISQGKDADWIKVYVNGSYGYVVDGKPVYPDYRDHMHVAPNPIKGNAALPLVIGIDFGLTPAAIFCQRTAKGQWLVIDELVTEDMGAKRFSEALSAHLAEHYGRFEVDAYGDPAGNQRSAADERTCLEIVREYAGIPIRPAPTNDPTMRIEAVSGALGRIIEGSPGLLLSPNCQTLRKGFSGGYHYRRLRVVGQERYVEKPDKNRYSHPHDALQYALIGAGEAAVLLRRESSQSHGRPRQAYAITEDETEDVYSQNLSRHPRYAISGD